MLSATLGVTATVDDVKNQIGEEHTQVADYIADNVTLFAEKYREETADEAFNPNEVEFRCEVFVVEDESYAEYLDFDGDNGYLLLADKYELLDFSTSGQLEWFSGDYPVVYSKTEGYCFYDSESNLIPFEREKLAQENADLLEENATLSKIYDGQEASGSGGIYNPDRYIQSRYGSGFNLKASKGNKNDASLNQNDFAVYTQYKNGKAYSEGNCLISACYLLMKSLMDSGKYRMSYATQYIDPKYDPFYNDLIKNPQKYGADRVTVSSRYLPLVYSQLRDYFIKNDGYAINGTDSYKADNAINAVGKYYGHSIGASVTSFYSFNSCVKDQIDKGKTSIWMQYLGGIYSHHAVHVIGYRTYEKVSKWWIFKSVETHNLMMINDNWGFNPMFIDYEQMSGSLDGLFGKFLKVK